MLISDLITILENTRSENGDIEIGLSLDNMLYELNSEMIDLVECELGVNSISINIDQFSQIDEHEGE